MKEEQKTTTPEVKKQRKPRKIKEYETGDEKLDFDYTTSLKNKEENR